MVGEDLELAQLENGFTRLANEILEHIAKTKLNGSQFRIVMAIFRFTYGFNRKEHAMSISFLAEATDMAKRQVQRELTTLIEAGIIKVVQEATHSSPAVLSFNKYFDQWRLNSQQTTKQSTGDELVVRGDDYLDNTGDDELVVRGDDGLVTQERQPKDNFKENSKDKYTSDFLEFWKVYPRKKEKKRAYKAWNARIKNKAGPSEMILAAKRYAAECEKNGTEIIFIKHAATFIGPGEPYKDYLDKDVLRLEERRRSNGQRAPTLPGQSGRALYAEEDREDPAAWEW